MAIENVTLRLATPGDLDTIVHADPELFDDPVLADCTAEFLADPRHHLALAFDGSVLAGMASAVHDVHPDKEPHLFINEVSVLEAWQGQGIGRALVRLLLDHGRSLGCSEAWVATEPENLAARRAYVAAGGVEVAEPFILIEWDLRQ